MTKTRIYAIANQKGGVGKTTTCVNLAASLVATKKKVLLVDLDPQGNATMGSGVDKNELEYSIYDVLMGEKTLSEVLVLSESGGYQVLPANGDLTAAEVEMLSLTDKEYLLQRAIQSVQGQFDYVVIDCPPSLNMLTLNAMVACNGVIIPMQCEYYALEGLGQLVGNVDLVRENLNPDLEVSSIALVMYDARTNLSEQVADEVRTFFGDKVCRQVIPRSVRLSEAPSFGQPITVFDPTCRGAIAYRQLAKEVLG